ncbi:glycosyltransferase family 2 protein [Rhodovulum sp. YNF3179]|uniref:glycosyltransferase family 2 protein n=1 Tax=Rhodovulum sp. YNF3179 TaxID=3425127 RepID=UPI003D34ED46
MTPKVSIVTPCFNSDRFLRQTYRSVLEQDYPNWEWIIHDDGSSDESARILVEIADSDERVKISFGKENRGPGCSRNICIDRAEGEFIAFLDADDLWLSNKVSSQLEFMGNECLFSFSPYMVIPEHAGGADDFVRVVDAHSPKSVSYNDMLKKKATLGCSTVMLHRSAIGASRMPNIPRGQDYAFWLSVLKRGIVAKRMDKPLTRYRVVSGSVSRNKVRKALSQWQILRNSERIGFFRSIYLFSFYAKNAVFRR